MNWPWWVDGASAQLIGLKVCQPGPEWTAASELGKDSKRNWAADLLMQPNHHSLGVSWNSAGRQGRGKSWASQASGCNKDLKYFCSHNGLQELPLLCRWPASSDPVNLESPVYLGQQLDKGGPQRPKVARGRVWVPGSHGASWAHGDKARRQGEVSPAPQLVHLWSITQP